jgi:hypothetical protein
MLGGVALRTSVVFGMVTLAQVSTDDGTRLIAHVTSPASDECLEGWCEQVCQGYSFEYCVYDPDCVYPPPQCGTLEIQWCVDSCPSTIPPAEEACPEIEDCVAEFYYCEEMSGMCEPPHWPYGYKTATCYYMDQ